MATREPKTRQVTTINVVGRNSTRKGKFELTSGNLIYYRQGAKVETLNISYQQLMSVLESHIEYENIARDSIPIPKSINAADFSINVAEIEDDESTIPIISVSTDWKRLDPRKLDLGNYQFDSNSIRSRKKQKYCWFVHVSVQAAIWILYRYIDKHLSNRKMSSYKDKDIVVSKLEMKSLLISLLKKVTS